MKQYFPVLTSLCAGGEHSGAHPLLFFFQIHFWEVTIYYQYYFQIPALISTETDD